MAFFSPTIATKRPSRSGASIFGGVSTIFIARARLRLRERDYTAPPRRIPISSAWRRRPFEAVVDRLSQAGARHRHHRDGGRALGIERAQVGKEIGRSLDEIAARGEVEHRRRTFGASRRRRAEGERRLARFDPLGIEPQLRPW